MNHLSFMTNNASHANEKIYTFPNNLYVVKKDSCWCECLFCRYSVSILKTM